MDEERKTEKFIKAVPGIMAILFAATCCIGFLRGMLSPEIFVTGIVTPVVTFFVAQKGQESASKQAAATALASPKTNGHAPPPTP